MNVNNEELLPLDELGAMDVDDVNDEMTRIRKLTFSFYVGSKEQHEPTLLNGWEGFVSSTLLRDLVESSLKEQNNDKSTNTIPVELNFTKNHKALECFIAYAKVHTCREDARQPELLTWLRAHPEATSGGASGNVTCYPFNPFFTSVDEAFTYNPSNNIHLLSILKRDYSEYFEFFHHRLLQEKESSYEFLVEVSKIACYMGSPVLGELASIFSIPVINDLTNDDMLKHRSSFVGASDIVLKQSNLNPDTREALEDYIVKELRTMKAKTSSGSQRKS